MTPTIIALDLETAGIASLDWNGAPIPPQRCFHPAKLLATDGIHPALHSLVCSVTVAASDPRRSPSDPISMTDLAALTPGTTRVFQLWNPAHRRMLSAWLSHATVILGMNLGYDLLFLRAHSDFRHRLLSRQLIDLSILIYLRDEQTPERSLKDIGPVLNLFRYDSDLLAKYETRHPRADSDSVRDLCAQDTHNSLLAISACARRILADHAGTPKATHETLAWYSPLIAAVVRMSEAGIAFSLSALHSLEAHLHSESTAALSVCTDAGLVVTGPGSAASRLSYLTSLISELSLSDHPLLEYTKRRREISWGNSNRDLVLAASPADHPARPVLRAWRTYAHAQKLLSTYTRPLLSAHTTAQRNPLRSRLVPDPRRSDLAYAYPTFYIVPSALKHSTDEGGTIQARLAAKDPPAQTFPPPVKACMVSRWGADGIIVSYDESQVELRVAALLSGDAALMGAYLRSEDLHTRRAVSLIGEPTLLSKYPALSSLPLDRWKSHPPFNDLERQAGKTVNFSDLFWAMARKMRLTIMQRLGLLLPHSLLENIVRSRHLEREGLVTWQHSLCLTAERDGILRLPFTGHSRYFDGFRLDHRRYDRDRILSQARTRGASTDSDADDPSNMLSEIVNFPVQTTAANLLHAVTVALLRALDSRRLSPSPVLINQIHDALYIDCPRRHLSALDDCIREAHEWVASPAGLWGRLSALHSRTVPLIYDRTLHDHEPHP